MQKASPAPKFADSVGLLAVGGSLNLTYILEHVGSSMVGLTRPKRRWWGWLFAAAYLLGLITPPLAMASAVGQHDVVAHHTEQSNAPGGCHEHHRAGVDEPAHVYDVAEGVDIDKRSVGHGHSSCCSSLCFSAISPRSESVLQLAMPRFRCDSEPDLKIDEDAVAERYRPPIT
jgi:hypothetical protein